MAVDTLRLQSPLIEDGVALLIESRCTQKQGLTCVDEFGDRTITYTVTRDELKGTWDSSLRVLVERERWVKPVRPVLVDGEWVEQSVGKPVRVPSEPYLVLEASVHKLLLGHNCWGGPLSCGLSGRWLVAFVSHAFGV